MTNLKAEEASEKIMWKSCNKVSWLEAEFARLAPKKSWQHGNLLVENGKEHDKMTVEAIDQPLEAFVNYVIVKQLFCTALVLRVA